MRVTIVTFLVLTVTSVTFGQPNVYKGQNLTVVWNHDYRDVQEVAIPFEELFFDLWIVGSGDTTYVLNNYWQPETQQDTIRVSTSSAFLNYGLNTVMVRAVRAAGAFRAVSTWAMADFNVTIVPPKPVIIEAVIPIE